MEINITWGVGEAGTELAAFDRALWDAGIANYNLIKLSSIIPDKAKIIVGKLDWNEREHGNRLYLVLSEAHQGVGGRSAAAGIGWIKEDGKPGLFVEGHGESEDEIFTRLRKTFESMADYRPGRFDKNHEKIASIKCSGRPVCAIVAAVYESRGWED